jgi:hypothetical protein
MFADGEVPAGEELEREHGVLRAPLVREERREREDASGERDEDRRAAPAVVRLLDQREDDPSERRHA